MSYLLSDYFFPIVPIVEDKEFDKVAKQLISMYTNNNIILNLIFYYFQLPNKKLLKIKEIYKNISGNKKIFFIDKFFKGEINLFLKKKFFLYLIIRNFYQLKLKLQLKMVNHGKF